MTTTSTSRALLLLAVAFVLGLVVGGSVMGLSRDDDRRRGNRGNCEVRSQRVCMWTEVLDLSAEQQEQLVGVYKQGEVAVDSIQRNIRPPIDSIYQTIRPAIDSQRMQLREEVKSILTPEQREKYDSTTTAWDEQRRQNRDRSSGAPGSQGGQQRDRP